MKKNIINSTTIIGIRKDNHVVIAGDGQASFGNTIMKANVKKVRRLGSDNLVIAGFAGSTADAFALFERLETKLDQYKKQLKRFVNMWDIYRSYSVKNIKAMRVVQYDIAALKLTFKK